MKAVVMAGGEGTRLRPMTASMPKPLLPIVNKPIMEHVLRLLQRHGITETVVTVQFLASLVRNYFGDGEELGMVLHYATEDAPLGTAGSVKNAEHLLNDGTLHVHVSLKSPLLGRKPWRHAEVESALTFQVIDPEDRATARGGFSGRIHGPVRPLLRWSTHALEPEDAPLLGRRRD